MIIILAEYLTFDWLCFRTKSEDVFFYDDVICSDADDGKTNMSMSLRTYSTQSTSSHELVFRSRIGRYDPSWRWHCLSIVIDPTRGDLRCM
jgi:hypothetical protein